MFKFLKPAQRENLKSLHNDIGMLTKDDPRSTKWWHKENRRVTKGWQELLENRLNEILKTSSSKFYEIFRHHWNICKTNFLNFRSHCGKYHLVSEKTYWIRYLPLQSCEIGFLRCTKSPSEWLCGVSNQCWFVDALNQSDEHILRANQ